jgi:general secretion pathway protein I
MRRRGFTLLEVLVALAIFAFASVVLGSAYVNILNAYEIAGRTNEHDADTGFARQQLLTEPDRTKAEEGDNFDVPGGRHVTWRSEIEPTETADLFQVTFTCEISDPGASTTPPPAKETFLLLRPTWADPVENGKLLQAAKDRIAELQGKDPAATSGTSKTRGTKP